jgi:hypothetical protein
MKTIVCQDRLGTNIGKTLHETRFLAGVEITGFECEGV